MKGEVLMRDSQAQAAAEDWFQDRGWSPFDYQRSVWRSYLEGDSGLVHTPTGTGKTLAVWFAPLLEALDEGKSSSGLASGEESPIRVVWITPLRALASDLETALLEPLAGFDLNWSVQSRTGDTVARVRARQKKKLPSALITTPESLSVLLSFPGGKERFRTVRLVVVDEWHELLSTKRGVQTELALARLKGWLPKLRIWGLSATLGNLENAMKCLMGPAQAKKGKLIDGSPPRRFEIESIVPDRMERFPWRGHLGLQLLTRVLRVVENADSTLLFTNTRAQAEIWYREMLEARPDWAGRIAIHHGSLDRKEREWVETSLRRGGLKCVVCTSTLDLGVDFSPVDQVIQIGSPKGVGRLLQRAGRSGHRPNLVSRVVCVPTHAFELVEVAAARDAASAGLIEGRDPLKRPLDVLAQHVVTLAAGDGFDANTLYQEVCSTLAYRDLSRDEWDWVLDFAARGGPALRVYPQYQKVVNEGSFFRVSDERVARKHRISIGTIASDESIPVRYRNGRQLGSIEAAFVAKLRKGDQFSFAGRVLELVGVREAAALVKKAPSKKAAVPRWKGGRMPLSTELARSVRSKLEEARKGIYLDPEMVSVRPILELQEAWSKIPGIDEVLVEELDTREGHHLFIYPFEGRLVHEGLASLIAFRISRDTPITFALSVNDYGIELLSPTPIPFRPSLESDLLTSEGLSEDIRRCLNASGMAKYQFRQIARVSGLVFPGYPGQRKRAKQQQVTSGLLYDVFCQI